MKLATIRFDSSSTSAAVEIKGQFVPLRLLEGRQEALDILHVIEHPLTDAELLSLENFTAESGTPHFMPPVLRTPKNIFCVGKNYREHVIEGAQAEGVAVVMPSYPIWFTKAHTSLIGHGSSIELDEGSVTELDYEAELAVVISKGGRYISEDQALSHIFGYTIINDVTARNIQQDRHQWFKGKSADTYAPCGPYVVTADDVSDYRNFRIQSFVNGDLRQDDVASNMIFGIPELISDLSHNITLEPGDIIATGTPAGVAWGKKKSRLLQDNSVVTIKIDGIGILENKVISK